MSLLFYGVMILGIMLGGLMLLLLFSLLTMAKRGDEALDKMELVIQTKKNVYPLKQKARLENLDLPTTSDLYHGGTT